MAWRNHFIRNNPAIVITQVTTGNLVNQEWYLYFAACRWIWIVDFMSQFWKRLPLLCHRSVGDYRGLETERESVSGIQSDERIVSEKLKSVTALSLRSCSCPLWMKQHAYRMIEKDCGCSTSLTTHNNARKMQNENFNTSTANFVVS